MASNFIFSDASTLAGLVRRKEVSPVEIMQIHLDRIAAVNPEINAIVTVADGALAAAKAAEAAVMAGDELGPLHGVPFTVKDSIDTAGVLTQRGSPIFRGRLPDTDATSVARMKQAGAILLGKTNLPEFSYWIESDNLLSGRTSNPWDVTRTPGGSSGGESAAIAAGMSPIGPRHRPGHLRAWSGRPDRHHLDEGDPWPRADDRDLAAGSAPLLACRSHGAVRARHRARFCPARRSRWPRCFCNQHRAV